MQEGEWQTDAKTIDKQIRRERETALLGSHHFQLLGMSSDSAVLLFGMERLTVSSEQHSVCSHSTPFSSIVDTADCVIT